ncbi:RNA polymerase sigma-70 factor [Candidatus Neomarinimicrobiota bacterium]
MGSRPPDTDHAELIRAGDQDAFRMLFDKYAVILLDYALSIVKDVTVSEDIVQTVFVNVWQNRSRLNPQLSLKAYLYKSVRNQSLKVIQHKQVEHGAQDNVRSLYYEPETEEDESLKLEWTAALDQAISQLPERCRAVLIMSKYDGLSYTEIASALEISINTVKTQMGRAFAAIRRALIDHR